ncbi:MAG: ABC-2 type transport system ATP-binding protein [Planctomycetota bacterium]|jgi:ABC-2 type transport system ATP-binding protein
MLSVRDLVKVYPGPVTALKGIGLELPPGMFGLLGPNGAGKSTFMRILAGLQEATSGEITLDGIDILNEPKRVWERLGYLPQEFGFYPQLTGRDMLIHLLRLKGVHAPGGVRKLANELLARVNLDFAAKRKVREYSGGMKQRLGIAQAIAGDPRLIIVDEPTAGLDPEERHRFYRILAELAEKRIVLLSTHIVEDVATLCPYFAVIREGRILARSTPPMARGALAGRMIQGEVDADEIKRLQEQATVTQVVLFEGRHRVRIFEPEGDSRPGFEQVEPTLEDAYLLAMRGGADRIPEHLPTDFCTPPTLASVMVDEQEVATETDA